MFSKSVLFANKCIFSKPTVSPNRFAISTNNFHSSSKLLTIKRPKVELSLWKKELLGELKSQGITNPAQVNSELKKLEGLYTEINKQVDAVNAGIERRMKEPLFRAFFIELQEKQAEIHEEFNNKGGPLTSHKVLELNEARSRLAEELELKYRNIEGDAWERIKEAKKLIAHEKGNLPKKRFKYKESEISLEERKDIEKALKEAEEKKGEN